MSEQNDLLSEFREFLSTPRHVGQVEQKAFPFRKQIGAQPRFKGNQEIRVSIVGNDRPEQILLETFDLKISIWNLTRWVLIEIAQLPELIRALLNGEVREANLSATVSSAWPEFPIHLADIPYADGGLLRVVLDHYNGFLDLKISMASADGSNRRNNLWAKLSPAFDVRPIIGMLIEAFDVINLSVDAGGDLQEAEPEDGMDF